MQMNAQEKTVLRTLALADAFGWALTAFEAWRFAMPESGERVSEGASERDCHTPYSILHTPTLLDVIRELNQLIQEGRLTETDGHYAFVGREALIQDRLWRSQLIGQKRRRARRWAKRLVRLPYVEGVFAYGSLATGHASKESDLDVFVVLRDGRIFTGRLLVSLFLETFGVRRAARKVTDQVCLNHFVIQSALTFPEAYRSPFSAWLWARMTPLAVADPTLEQRFNKANDWIREFFPNVRREIDRDSMRLIETDRNNKSLARSAQVSTNLHKSPLDFVERWLGKVQLQRIAKHPLTQKGKGRVVANEREMIFHPGLPEEAVMKRFRGRLRLLGAEFGKE